METVFVVRVETFYGKQEVVTRVYKYWDDAIHYADWYCGMYKHVSTDPVEDKGARKHKGPRWEAILDSKYRITIVQKDLH